MARERVTVTIRRDLLERVDQLKNNLTVRSRSQAFEYLLSKALAAATRPPALVLAGGRKKDVMLNGQNKFLTLLLGKPLLRHVFDRLHQFHVQDMVVYLDTYALAIRGMLESQPVPYNVSFVESDTPQGTLTPLRRARHRFTSTFMVAYGDTLCSADLSDMLAFHQRQGALATLALTTVKDPRHYGVVVLKGNNVESFTQKPTKQVESYLVNAGYMFFEPEIFDTFKAKDTSLERDLFPRLARAGKLFGYPFQGTYLNFGPHTNVEEAEQLIKDLV